MSDAPRPPGAHAAAGAAHDNDFRDGIRDDFDDSAPGDNPVMKGIRSYLVGLGLAALLTVASFVVAGTDLIYGPGIPTALAALAIAQMGIHLVFFLHITTSPDNTNNVLALAFGVLIVFLVVGGSMWIMDHLNSNMMPMNVMMQMQR